MPLKRESVSWSCLRLPLVILFVTIWVLLELNLEETDFSFFVPHTRTDHLPSDASIHHGYVVNTIGCRIPDMDPFDVTIQKYIYDEAPIECWKKFGLALVESNLTSIYINESVLASYNVTDMKEINCCYRPFWRLEAKKKEQGQYSIQVDALPRFASNCTPFEGTATIHHEFVKVECYINGSKIYTDFHAFIPQKRTTYPQSVKHMNEKQAVSVLLFGVDAVSRLNLYRQMPETLKFLKGTLKAVEMFGYNKVEDNTFPNLIPVISGLTVEELQQTCWFDDDHVFDDCNFIWNDFSVLGYKTAFGEDASWMGMFNYLKRGFRKQPTDYYMSLFNRASENENGFDKRLNANLCVGPRKNLEVLLTYAHKFLITMKEQLSFSFFWGNSISHDYLNLPKQGDEDHKQFLKHLYDQGVFENTILVFMSDHGIRWGAIRETYQGYLEERLPFLFVAYPDWFRIKYTTAVSNLKRNEHKLTTPFDLYRLLSDLTDLTSLENKALRKRSEKLQNIKPLPRGISLFLPIPENRTCSDAGIIDHWCTCHQSQDVSISNSEVNSASRHLVKHINGLLKEYPMCSTLKLNKILHAREERSHTSYNTTYAITDISVTIETTPGKGLFEATVRRDENKKNFTVVGTISRINVYGDQSRCMPNYKLRLYCYCFHD